MNIKLKLTFKKEWIITKKILTFKTKSWLVLKTNYNKPMVINKKNLVVIKK